MPKKKICIIEDNQILLSALKLKFAEASYRICSAIDGKRGVEMVKEEKPDLIVLDILLPKIGGFDVLELIKKDNKSKDIPVVILSNLNQEENKKKGLKLGAVHYYVKSLTTLDELVENIDKILKSK